MATSTGGSPTRRWRVPLVLITAAALAVGGQWAFVQLEGPPKAAMPIGMATMIVCLIAVLGGIVWFLFLGGFRARTRLAVIGLLGAAVGAFLFMYRLEWDSMMRLIAVPRWAPTPDELLAKHLARRTRVRTALTSGDWEIAAYDFPRYRGPRADGVAAYQVVDPKRFADAPPEKVWEQPCGGGYSGFAVAGSVLVTLEQRDESEAVVCYKRDNGAEVWVHEYPARFQQSGPMGGDGPRSTPTIHDGKVYTLGAVGDLHCIDGESGNVLWKRNIITDNGAVVPKWGVTSSPLLAPSKKGDIVVVIAGVDPRNNQKKSLAAYASETGEPVWASGSHPAGYSSPVLAELDGVRQIVAFMGGGVEGRDVETGSELWRFDWTTMNEMNIVQPLLLPGDRVYISSFNEGAALLEVKRIDGVWRVAEKWRQPRAGAHYANPVYHDGAIYGLAPTGTTNFLTCIDAETGKRLWRHDGSFGAAQLLVSGGILLMQTERPCEIIVLKPTTKGYEELSRFAGVRGVKTWNTPALAGGFLYLRNNESMACFDVRPAAEK
jgi:outer membrane protein assembly factor BamB